MLGYLYSGTALAANSTVASAQYDETPVTTRDKIIKAMEKSNSHNENQHIQNRIQENERQAGAAFDILIKEIDALKELVASLDNGKADKV